ncbi:MAG: replication-associated recombination protein A [Oligoflexia bacterium]|nr:replication-associated recombination protein A [Oligoflexia bacterium]
MDDLFSTSQTQFIDSQPLAERVRPQNVEAFVGQKYARELLKAEKLPSLILWGPPGSGKTTFSHLVSKYTKSTFISRSAIDTGSKDLKLEGEDAKQRLLRFSEKTILFIDEIHRLNKSQQDCILPYIEKGYFTLIGASTENPSFELNSALLSRCQVIVFESLNADSISAILDRALKSLDTDIEWKSISASPINEHIIQTASGDARRALNLLENVYSYYVSHGSQKLNDEQIKEAFQYIPTRYDKSGDKHYDTISAFIKSIRGSDPHAALFYLSAMLKGGEDPLFIARRLVILASEDVGNADPRALQVAISVKQAVEFVGLPEAAINLAQGVTYLSCAPKSNRSYAGLKKAQELVEKHPDLEPPLSIRNAPTRLMENLGYGEKYQYAHDSKSGVTAQEFMPDKLKNIKIYEPTKHGYEKHISQYLEWVEEQKK